MRYTVRADATILRKCFPKVGQQKALVTTICLFYIGKYVFTLCFFMLVEPLDLRSNIVDGSIVITRHEKGNFGIGMLVFVGDKSVLL